MRRKNPNFDRDKDRDRNDDRRSSFEREKRSENKPARSGENRKPKSDRPFEKKSREDKPFNKDRKPFERRETPKGGRSFDKKVDTGSDRPSERRSREDRPFSREKRPFEKRTDERSDRPFGKRSGEDRPFSRDKKPFERRGSGPKRFEKKEFGDRAGKSESADRSSDRNDRKSTGTRSFRPDDRKDKPFSEGRGRRESSFGNKKRAGGDRLRPEFNKFRNKRTTRIKETEDDGLIRLNRFIANSGICSRRQADEYIRTGLVEVNGTVVTEMGHKVKPEDDVRFDGQRITPERKTYLLLNKPKGFITTTSDERDRKTVMDLVANATKARLFPVGRLDRQTTGVLLFTNDGHLAKKLTHPSHNIKKIYHVILDKNLHGDDMEKIRQGILMQEGVAKVDKISFIEGKKHNEVGLEIHIGWNRVVRRIFEKLGYKIEQLDRVQFAGLTKKNVKRGDWRLLDEKEVNFLKML